MNKRNNTKLSEEDVLEIYKLAHESVMTTREISFKFDICESNVGYIKFGKTWSNVTGHKNDPGKKKVAQLTTQDVHKIYILAKAGKLSETEIGKMFNVTKNAIRSIANGHSWIKVTAAEANPGNQATIFSMASRKLIA